MSTHDKATLPNAWPAMDKKRARWTGCPAAPAPLPQQTWWRRVRVMPNSHGTVLIMAAVVAGIAAARFRSALVFAWVVFLWMGVAMMLVKSHRNVAKIRLKAVESEPSFAGSSAWLKLTFDSLKGSHRGVFVHTTLPDDAGAMFNIDRKRDTTVALMVPMPERGVFRMGPLCIRSIQPVAVAETASWIWGDGILVVYPAPESDGPTWRQCLPADQILEAPPPPVGPPDVDAALLRPYRMGDSAHHISWKASARHQKLLARDAPPPPQGAAIFKWEAVSDLPTEAALSRLARWICEADREGVTYTLMMPHEQLGPAKGSEHFHRCLNLLAHFPK